MKSRTLLSHPMSAAALLALASCAGTGQSAGTAAMISLGRWRLGLRGRIGQAVRLVPEGGACARGRQGSTRRSV
jgi:hypothetical protein